MTALIARRPRGFLIDDHIVVNPVTGLPERTILLERHRVWENGAATDPSAQTVYWRYSFSGIYNTGLTAPDGSNTAWSYHPTTSVGGGTVARVDESFTPKRENNTYRGWTYNVVGAPLCRRHWFKASATITELEMTTSVGATNASYLIDLAAGTVSPSGSFVSVSKKADGWCEIVWSGVVAPASGQTIGVNYDMSRSGNSGFTKATTDEVLMWLPDPESSSYYPSAAGPYGGVVGTDDATADAQPYFFPLAHAGAIPVIPLPSSVQTPAALTVYLEWFDRFNGFNPNVPGIFRLGNHANTGDGISVTQTSTGFSGTYTNGGSTSTATVALTTTLNDLVTLRATLDSAGALTLNASKNGATEVNGTAGSNAGLAGSWSDNLITLNCLGVNTPSKFGDIALRKLRVFQGVQTLAVCSA